VSRSETSQTETGQSASDQFVAVRTTEYLIDLDALADQSTCVRK
jgi:hypothetical protein